MEMKASLNLKLAEVKIKLGPTGFGQTIINGIDISNVIAGVSVRSRIGEATVVSLDIHAEQVEFETPEDVATVINWLRQDPPKPLEHIWGLANVDRSKDICDVCRQVRRVAMPYCPGPPK